MPFSHHSHSGQFCPGHAQNTLEQVVQTAIAKQMQVLALTEHMPRHEQDFYPEEREAGLTVEWHWKNIAEYYQEAIRLRKIYGHVISLLIGFESDWIRPESLDLIERLLKRHAFDFFVGSVHHVHTLPIDYDQEYYVKARDVSGGTDERLFTDYFDAQLDMLKAVKPPVVGHFDLIRLKSDDPNKSFRPYEQVWGRVLRNLDFVVSYGGILELNFAALRKGMSEPYPMAEICQEFLARGGQFCLSDDSHSTGQVALNYHEVLPFLRKVQIPHLCYLGHAEVPISNAADARFPTLQVSSASLPQVASHAFWETKRAAQR